MTRFRKTSFMNVFSSRAEDKNSLLRGKSSSQYFGDALTGGGKLGSDVDDLDTTGMGGDTLSDDGGLDLNLTPPNLFETATTGHVHLFKTGSGDPRSGGANNKDKDSPHNSKHGGTTTPTTTKAITTASSAAVAAASATRPLEIALMRGNKRDSLQRSSSFGESTTISAADKQLSTRMLQRSASEKTIHVDKDDAAGATGIGSAAAMMKKNNHKNDVFTLEPIQSSPMRTRRGLGGALRGVGSSISPKNSPRSGSHHIHNINNSISNSSNNNNNNNNSINGSNHHRPTTRTKGLKKNFSERFLGSRSCSPRGKHKADSIENHIGEIKVTLPVPVAPQLSQTPPPPGSNSNKKEGELATPTAASAAAAAAGKRSPLRERYLGAVGAGSADKTSSQQPPQQPLTKESSTGTKERKHRPSFLASGTRRSKDGKSGTAGYEPPTPLQHAPPPPPHVQATVQNISKSDFQNSFAQFDLSGIIPTIKASEAAVNLGLVDEMMATHSWSSSSASSLADDIDEDDDEDADEEDAASKDTDENKKDDAGKRRKSKKHHHHTKANPEVIVHFPEEDFFQAPEFQLEALHTDTSTTNKLEKANKDGGSDPTDSDIKTDTAHSSSMSPMEKEVLQLLGMRKSTTTTPTSTTTTTRGTDDPLIMDNNNSSNRERRFDPDKEKESSLDERNNNNNNTTNETTTSQDSVKNDDEAKDLPELTTTTTPRRKTSRSGLTRAQRAASVQVLVDDSNRDKDMTTTDNSSSKGGASRRRSSLLRAQSDNGLLVGAPTFNTNNSKATKASSEDFPLPIKEDDSDKDHNTDSLDNSERSLGHDEIRSEKRKEKKHKKSRKHSRNRADNNATNSPTTSSSPKDGHKKSSTSHKLSPVLHHDSADEERTWSRTPPTSPPADKDVVCASYYDSVMAIAPDSPLILDKKRRESDGGENEADLKSPRRVVASFRKMKRRSSSCVPSRPDLLEVPSTADAAANNDVKPSSTLVSPSAAKRSSPRSKARRRVSSIEDYAGSGADRTDDDVPQPQPYAPRRCTSDMVTTSTSAARLRRYSSTEESDTSQPAGSDAAAADITTATKKKRSSTRASARRIGAEDSQMDAAGAGGSKETSIEKMLRVPLDFYDVGEKLDEALNEHRGSCHSVTPGESAADYDLNDILRSPRKQLEDVNLEMVEVPFTTYFNDLRERMFGDSKDFSKDFNDDTEIMIISDRDEESNVAAAAAAAAATTLASSMGVFQQEYQLVKLELEQSKIRLFQATQEVTRLEREVLWLNHRLNELQGA